MLALVDTECLGLSAASAGGNTFVAWGKPYVAQAWGMAVGPTMSVLLAPTRLDVGSNYERKPQVASNGSSFLVVWDAAASAGGTGRILGRRVTSAGALVGTASFVVGTHAQRSYERSAVASNGTDFLVSYDTSNPYKRYVARVTASGSVLDPDGVPLPGSLYVSAQRYGIGYDGTRYVVPGFDASGGRYALGYVRVSATGTPDAALTVLETATSGLAPPTMFVVGGGGRTRRA
ncbi:MAG: hypothetical protein U0169_22995 [Polyangiaceae bacterium]